MPDKKHKFRNTIKDLIGRGQFIPGIYNYCDRWCERCTLSHKCLTYAHELELMAHENEPETEKLAEAKYWKELKISFDSALELIADEAKERGIDIKELPVVEYEKPEESVVEKASGYYSKSMCNWLNVHKNLFVKRADDLMLNRKNKRKALKFIDALEVIQWFCFYISAKVHRSHVGLDEHLNREGYDPGVLWDNRGSAKVAILAVDRSIEALLVIYYELPELEDEILSFLSQLAQIKAGLLVVFPTAMEFKRPGFDD